MGERGPRPDIVTKLTPEDRKRLDEAIIEGAESKTILHERFAKPHDISYRTFCTYALALEQTARHRYVGELLTKVFGNLPDSEIDIRARGIMMAMLDRIAGDVLNDRELQPKDLRHVVQSYDILRRGTIAEAQETRRRDEWGAARMAGVAEAAVWIKDAVAEEIGRDKELCVRIEEAVDSCCARIGKPENDLITSRLLEKYATKAKWSKAQRDIVKLIWGVDIGPGAGKPKPPRPTLEETRQKVHEVYGIVDKDSSVEGQANGERS